MSGHNKWSKIKHSKGKADAARGKLFNKLIREITVATRMGGKDIEGNARLRSAIITARAGNMPNDTIERAIKRGAGEIEGEVYEELTYEGYGPGGVAYVIEAATTNRNRTVQDIRSVLTKHGGHLGTDGSVSWMFELRGQIEIPGNFDRVFEVAVEAGAVDVQPGDEAHLVLTEYTGLNEVNRALEKAGLAASSCRAVRLPTTTVAVEGRTAETTLKLIEALDDLDDVQNVYTNADISDAEMARLGG